jgi:hypothetical protein
MIFPCGFGQKMPVGEVSADQRDHYEQHRRKDGKVKGAMFRF